MRHWMRKRHKAFSVCGLLAVVNSLCPIIYASFLQKVIDGLNTAHIWNEMIALVGIGAAHMLILFLFRYFGNRFNADIYADNRKRLVEKLNKIPLEDSDKLGIGHLLALYNDDIRRVSDFIGKQLPIIFSDIGFLVFAYIYLFNRDWMTAIVVLAVTIYLLPFFRRTAAQLQAVGRTRQATMDRVLNVESNIITGMLDIQINNASEWFRKQFGHEAREYAQSDFAFEKTQAKHKFLLGIQYNIGLLVVLFMSGISLTQGRMTLGGIISVYALYARLSTGIRKITSHITAYTALKNNLNRLNAIEQIGDEKGVNAPPDVLFPLQIEHVAYSYDGERMILDQINLTIECGRRVAIIGESGCGKSTLAKLVCRYTDHYKGKIAFHGADISELNAEKLRARVIYVSNDFFLVPELAAKIIEQTPQEKLDKWVHVLEIEYIVSIAQRTIAIQENAQNLSGGERQRLLLLLALLQDAEMYIFDEMLSSIQRALAKRIFDQIKEHIRATVIMITHQMDILPSCTDVVYMASGRVLMRGRHEQLLMQSADYRNFVDAVQKGGDSA